MGRLMTAYTVYFNKRHHRAGHLAQGRFSAQMVEGNEYLLKLSRSIHLNPVCGKRWKGVPVEQRQQALRSYRWSTYRGYAGLQAEWPFID
jgi:putative transposase